MAAPAQEIDSRLIKMTLSSVLKIIEALKPDIDAHETVRQHMLGICAGVRQRALEAAGDDIPSDQATAQVDALTKAIDEYIDYSASPLFGDIQLIRPKD